MPTYEYVCTNCGTRKEIFQKITDKAEEKCHSCGLMTLQRGIGGGIGIVFKGNGFYSTDYKTSESSDPSLPQEKKSSKCCPCGKNKNACSTKETLN